MLCPTIILLRRRGERCWYDPLRAGPFGVRTPVGGRFLHPARLALMLNQPRVQWSPGLFQGLKADGA